MKKLLALMMAIVFATTTMTTAVFAFDNGKDKGKGKGNEGKAYNFYVNNAKDDEDKDDNNNFNFLNISTKHKINSNAAVSQTEALAAVLKAAGYEGIASKNVKNNPKYKGKEKISEWALGYVYVAIEKGILIPSEMKAFNPNAAVKRHELAKYVVRAMGKKDDAVKNMDAELDFNDVKSIPADSVGYIYVVNQLSIMTADKNDNFQPLKAVSGKELNKVIEYMKAGHGTPAVEPQRADMVFTSINKSDSKITVRLKNGTSQVYVYVPGAPVYKNNTYTTVDGLAVGDALKFTLGSDKKVLFIQVTGNEQVTDPSTTTQLSTTTIAYDNLPARVQEAVDSIKTTANYKAYTYNDKVYLVATLGQKATDGYSVTINNVTSTQASGSKTISAVVTATEPGTAVVTQVVTYPMSIVRFNLTSGMSEATFTNSSGTVLARTSLVALNHQVTNVTGKITAVDTTNRTITILKSNNTSQQYVVPQEAQITLNDSSAAFSALAVNLTAELTITDGIVTAVEASDNVVTVSGILVAVNMAATPYTITLRVGTTDTVYQVPNTAVIKIDGHNESLADLPMNSNIVVKTVNNVVTEVTK